MNTTDLTPYDTTKYLLFEAQGQTPYEALKKAMNSVDAELEVVARDLLKEKREAWAQTFTNLPRVERFEPEVLYVDHSTTKAGSVESSEWYFATLVVHVRFKAV